MPVPDFQSIMLPLLEITADWQEHKQIEVRDKLALQFQLDDADQEEKLPGGGFRFDNNVAWSVVYLRKAGLLENYKRGIFHITEQGRKILKTNPTKIDIKMIINRNIGGDEVYLLQDLQQPRHFITAGPWKNIQRIEAWRQLPEFKEFFAKAKEMCDEITPLTMKPIVHLKWDQQKG